MCHALLPAGFLSQIMQAQLFNIHPLAHILGTGALISVVVSFLQFTPTASCNGIPKTFTFLLSALLLCSMVFGTITPSYRHFSHISKILYCSAHFLVPYALYPSFILCTSSLSHFPSDASCDPRYLKQSISSNG